MEQNCDNHSYYIVLTTSLNMPIITGDYYLGCYNEHEHTNINDKMIKDYSHKSFYSFNVPKLCSKSCNEEGFSYFGLTNNKFCWCENILPNHISKVDDHECSAQCTGDANKYCGGESKIAFFRIGKDSLVFLKFLDDSV